MAASKYHVEEIDATITVRELKSYALVFSGNGRDNIKDVRIIRQSDNVFHAYKAYKKGTGIDYLPRHMLSFKVVSDEEEYDYERIEAPRINYLECSYKNGNSIGSVDSAEINLVEAQNILSKVDQGLLKQSYKIRYIEKINYKFNTGYEVQYFIIKFYNSEKEIREYKEIA